MPNRLPAPVATTIIPAAMSRMNEGFVYPLGELFSLERACQSLRFKLVGLLNKHTH